MSNAHRYHSGNPVAMRRTAWATLISLFMMIGEIVAGYMTGSMALLADGWHMATHVLALGLSWLAFKLSARLADDSRFAFGTGKLEVLASFVSALLLLAVGGWMALESVARLLAPTEVRFMDAMIVAVIGLWVNLVCALLLHQKSGPAAGHGHGHLHGHSHSHGHGHSHSHGLFHGHSHGHSHADGHGQNHHHSDNHDDGHSHHHSHDHSHDHSHAEAHEHDHAHRAESTQHAGAVRKPANTENLNLKAAYLHVLADALTSILAIVALLFGQVTGLPQVDSLMGLVGAILVVVWARGLITQSGWFLLDAQAPPALHDEVRTLVGRLADNATIAELKLWQISSGKFACNLLLSGTVTDAPALREALMETGFIVHLALEVQAASQEHTG